MAQFKNSRLIYQILILDFYGVMVLSSLSGLLAYLHTFKMPASPILGMKPKVT